MRSTARVLPAAVWLLILLPSTAFAQASIAGVVRDASMSVLPGVTVEVASPALIEKVRTGVTDGAGQYRIENLRPGVYSVTFSLTGFSTLKRDGIELSGSFATSVNAELKVGAVEETINVSAEAPIVDVQSGSKQSVLRQDVLTGLPTGRTQFTAATLIPGMNLNNQDVGGTNIINTTGGSMTIHGSNGNDQRVMIDGLSTANSELAGNASNFLPNMGSTQEMAVDYSAGTADQMTGGVRINMIPRDGGNTFKGSFFGTAVNDAFQGNNYAQALKDRGLRTPNSIKLQVRLQSRARRAAQGEQAVVLRVGALGEDAELRRRHVLQQERRHCRCLDVRSRSVAAGVSERVSAQRERPPDVAGKREEQVQRLRRRSGPLPVRERDGDDRRRRRPSISSIRSSG